MTDLGVKIFKFMFNNEVGAVLTGFLLAGLVKLAWNKKLKELFAAQYAARKYFVFLAISLLGGFVYIIAEDQGSRIASFLGLALVGIGLMAIVSEAWVDYLKPFITDNITRTIIMIVAVLGILFAWSFEEATHFPAFATLTICFFTLGASLVLPFKHTYDTAVEKWPSLSVRENYKKVRSK